MSVVLNTALKEHKQDLFVVVGFFVCWFGFVCFFF